MVTRRQEVLAFAGALCLHALGLFILRATIGERLFMAPPPRTPQPSLSFDVELGEFPVTESSAERERSGGGDEQRIASVRLRERGPGLERAQPELGAEASELEEPEAIEGTIEGK